MMKIGLIIIKVYWEVKEIDVKNGLMQIILEQNVPKKQLIPINKSNALEQLKEGS